MRASPDREPDFLSILTNAAPTWALCGNTPREAGHEHSRRPAEEAVIQRFYQPTPRNQCNVLVLDIDHELGWHCLDAAPPNYSVMNPLSGHRQVGYLLACPVNRARTARAEPQRLLNTIYRGLVRELRADAGYTGLLARGPGHADHVLQVLSVRSWTLDELLCSLPPQPGRRRYCAAHVNDMVASEGRNCRAFERLRHVAYAAAQRGLRGDDLRRELQMAAEQLNMEELRNDPAGPLGTRELAGIVQSICTWMTKNHRAAAASVGGTARSRQRTWEREIISAEDRRLRQQAGQKQAAEDRRDSTHDEVMRAIYTLQQAGQPVTLSALQRVTGLSRPTVIRYRRLICE